MAISEHAYLYEFLYRGRPPGSDLKSDYHVVMAVTGTDALGNPVTHYTSPMTPDVAVGHGVVLPKLLDAINIETMAEVASLTAKVAELQGDINNLSAEIIHLRRLVKQQAAELDQQAKENNDTGRVH